MRLTDNEIRKKIQYHEKRVEFYKKKLSERISETKRIGFKW